MSILDKCRDCLGCDCTLDVCLFNNQSYITTQRENKDKETARRKELKQQAERLTED